MITKINHIAIVVNDLDVSLQAYQRCLACRSASAR